MLAIQTKTKAAAMEEAATILLRCRKDPEYLRNYILGVDLDQYQAELFDLVWANFNGELGGEGLNRVAAAWANEAGKTYTAAALALAFGFTFRPSKVIITSKTGRQAERQTWDEVTTIYHRSEFFQELADLGHPFGELQKTKLEIGPGHWILHFSVAGGKSAEDIEAAFEGFHQINMLLIQDEAKRQPVAVFNAGERLFRRREGGIWRWLCVSSTGHKQAPFGKLFYGPQADLWKHHTLSAWDSPRVSDEACQEALDTHGEDSPLYKSMVASIFLDQAEDALIKLEWVRKAMRSPKAKKFTGVDVEIDLGKIGHETNLPENGYGAVRALGGKKQVGIDWARLGKNKTVFAPRCGGYVFPLRKIKKSLGTWAAAKVKDLMVDFPGYALVSDEAGLGGPIQDLVEVKQKDKIEKLGQELAELEAEAKERNDLIKQIKQLARAKIRGVLVGRPPEDPKKARYFTNIRACMFWDLMLLLKKNYEQGGGLISLPHDPALEAGLCAIRYEETEDGRIRLISKKKLKKDEGDDIPLDEPDAVAMAFWKARSVTLPVIGRG